MLEAPAATCRRCATPIPPGTPEELFELGWGDGGSLCPSCRDTRNARARATTNRIVAGLAEHYADQHAGSRTVTVRELPSFATRSTWVAWGADAISGAEARAMWRELGPGAYLVTMKSASEEAHVVVDVDDDLGVEMEPLRDERELRAVLVLAASPPADAGRPSTSRPRQLHR